MKVKWYKNLRTILKNEKKDAESFRHVNFWSVRGIRNKTQLSMKIQEGLEPRYSMSNYILGIEWKAANRTKILKAIEDLKKLVNEKNFSQNKLHRIMDLII